MKRTALALTFIFALLISAIAGIASSKATSADAESAVPLTISITSLVNNTYLEVDWVNQTNVEEFGIPLAYETNEEPSWVGYSINGNSNVTVSENSTVVEKTTLPQGIFPYQNSLILYANDTFGNWATPITVTFYIDPTFTFASNQSAKTTTVSFIAYSAMGHYEVDTLSVGPHTASVVFTTGFGNITISKGAVVYGTTPTVYIDGQPASNQSFTQDSNYYYVWYTTQFSTYEVSTVFTTTSMPSPTLSAFMVLIIAVVIIVIVAVGLSVYFQKHKRKQSSTNDFYAFVVMLSCTSKNR